MLEINQNLKDKIKNLPKNSGVYKMYDRLGNLIYVGKAKNLKNRVSSYFVDTSKPEKVEQMVKNIANFEYIITFSEIEALNLESNLIKQFKPFYNILLKDDKAFPYLKINLAEDYPVVELTRRIAKDKALYFGPYFGNINAISLLKIIENAFCLRKCKGNVKKNNSRGCLNFQIGECLAPCINNVDKNTYKKEVKNVIDFLNGNLTIAKNILEQKMQKCASIEAFERAIQIRESLKMIEHIKRKLITGLTTDFNADIFGYADNGYNGVISVGVVRNGKMIGLNNYSIITADKSNIKDFVVQYYLCQKLIPSNIIISLTDEVLNEWLQQFCGHKVNVIMPQKGVKKQLLEMANKNAIDNLEKSIEKDAQNNLKTIGAMNRLQSLLNLKSVPYRIEGYDISNLSGTNTVASMVVFTNGDANKNNYRKFKIESVGQNDFLNMKNVLKRRLSELKSDDSSFSNLPNLILIDGGAVQLRFASEALEEAKIQNVDIISLAKKDEEIYTLNGEILRLPKSDYALKLLQNIRDESHRFAITFQKNLRVKNNFKSQLESINLIGKNKINKLYEHFKTLDNIKKANIDELSQVDGIGKKLATNIFDYFNK